MGTELKTVTARNPRSKSREGEKGRQYRRSATFFFFKSIEGRGKCFKTVNGGYFWVVGYWLFTIFFLGITALSGTSSRILNCGGDEGQPCLISDFSGNTSDSSQEVRVCCGFRRDSLYQGKVGPLYSWLVKSCFSSFLNHK